jgi:Flp pilus assembly pilin Flp
MACLQFHAAETEAPGEHCGCLWRFLNDDGAQDLIEYALLAAFVGIAGWAAVMTIDEIVGAAYGNWTGAETGPLQNNGGGLTGGGWDPPEPISSGG